ncbi:MRC1 protein, partial [Asarcornis scutulata]|nr:MRC1 protein [Asarcornis scutulata]
MSWAQSVTQCIQSGGTLASVEDLAESNFLAEQADLHTSKTSGFWIGIYRNADGSLLWQDNSAFDFVNWGEEEPSMEQLDYCVQLSASSGYWSAIPCSSEKGFICKKPKSTLLITLYLFTDAKKDKEHGQSTVWILTLVVIILVAMGFMAYFLFKIKNQSETQRAVRQYSTLLEHSSNLPGGDDDNDPASNKEKDEHSII